MLRDGMGLPDPYALARDGVEALGPWMLAIVAVTVLVETTLGLGFLSPGEAVLAVSGAAAADGVLALEALLLVVFVFGLCGDGLSYAAGRRWGERIVGGTSRRLGLTAERVAATERLYAERGGWVLVAGRFVGPVRAVAPFVAGAAGMRYRKFAGWDAAGIALWGGGWVLLGVLFASSLESASGRIALAGAGFFGAGLLVAWRLNRRASA